jgi:hypothetical protein
MSPAQQPSQRNQANGTARSIRSRQRSTIGINPLDQPRLRPTAEGSASGPSALASQSGQRGSGQHVFAAWAAATQGILEALFETQGAALQANLGALEASANARRRIVQHWTQAALQAQSAALEAFQAGLQAASPPLAEHERSRRG